MEKLFNLIDEKWIMVLRNDYVTEEVSLKELFANAHLYRDLAGELPTQNVAILRLLLAILFAVFLRQDVDGSESSLTIDEDYEGNPDDIAKRAVERWARLWKMGKFPTDVIDAYFAKWHDRFWLFHPERPFYQVAGLKIGTEYSASKLNGTLSESSNKKRLFPNTTGEARERLTYAEAARWLLYAISFDDTSAKPKQKNLPSPGAGWLGKLGLVYAHGKNLYETMMLNLTLLKDGANPWFNEPAAWELTQTRTGERIEIPLPHNPSALYTLQSRRIALLPKEGFVVGYLLLGGDFFQKENAYAEQMTCWIPVDDKSRSNCKPKRHQFEKQMWREFSTLIGQSGGEGVQLPGVVQWTAMLRRAIKLPSMAVTYRIASVQYGDKDFYVTHVFEDALVLNLDLLNELGAGWRDRIQKEVKTADELAECIRWLADDLQKAGGAGISAQQAKEEFYYKIDIPFRRWLEGIDPVNSKNEEIKKWRINEYRIVRSLGKELIDNAGATAFVGRDVPMNKNSTKKKLYCSAQSYNDFCFRINKCLGGIVDEK